MVVLGIDQATVTGWSIIKDGRLISSGVWKLSDNKRSGESRGMRYIRFRAKLNEAIRRYRPAVICHEQTLLRGGAATEIANGLKALILEAAASATIEVSCVHTSELKKWATGSGKAEKLAMIGAARALTGRAPADDNEADAILIGLWAAERLGDYKKGALF